MKANAEPEGGKNVGQLSRFLGEDHRRLETLLQSALVTPDHINEAAYNQFRAGLLRHIGMEEKILMPTIQHRGDAGILHIAAKLRLEHGALAALLMPTPTAAIVALLRRVLAEHNAVEEGPAGLYQVCDGLGGTETQALLIQLRAAPEVKVMRYNDSPAVMKWFDGHWSEPDIQRHSDRSFDQRHFKARKHGPRSRTVVYFARAFFRCL